MSCCRKSTVRQCTAVALLPAPEHLARFAVPGFPLQDGHVLCELGEGHADDHAQMLWDDDLNSEGIWVRWGGSGSTATLTGLPWCPATDDRGDACWLFAGHPSGHAWQVVDPTMEALGAEMARLYPHLYRHRGESDPG
ncbi:hypothetical protein [Streptomyces physcomitrii]|uniref:hypothetical protein n=1 Tax=Streptomyces physcomitrii TaxID=2724184 RepID=UPI003F4D1121